MDHSIIRRWIGLHLWRVLWRILLNPVSGYHPLCRVDHPENIEGRPITSMGDFLQAVGPIRFGEDVWIAPCVGIITANHDLDNLSRNDTPRPVTIGNHCWIGMNAVIMPGVTLGDHTVVGAGSVVTHSFPEGNCVIAGNPAKEIRKLEEEKMCLWERYQETQKYEDLTRWLKHRAYMRYVECCKMKIQKISLQELKDKDVETYDRINAISLSNFGFKAEDNPNVRIMDYIIGGEIQRSIQARKWFMRIFQKGNYNPFTGLFLDEKSIGYEADVGPIDDFTAVARDTPGSALLDAYLEELEIDAYR